MSQQGVTVRGLAALTAAVLLLLSMPRPVAACLAYSNPGAWTFHEPPRLVLTAVIADVRGARYLAEVEQLYRGHIESPFILRDPDGCHLPDLKTGQRVLLMSAGGDQGNRHPASTDTFTDASGPLWVLDDGGKVIPQQGIYDGTYRGPRLNGVWPRTLAQALRLIDIPPNTAMSPPAVDLATPIGTILVLVAGAAFGQTIGRRRRDRSKSLSR